MRTQFLLLFYLRYNQSLLSYFSFISFFNYYLKMVIIIVYLILKGFVSLYAFIHLCFYVNVLLFYWVYSTSFFDHYNLTKYLFLFIQVQPLGYLLQNSCSKSVLNEIKYACAGLDTLRARPMQIERAKPLRCTRFFERAHFAL